MGCGLKRILLTGNASDADSVSRTFEYGSYVVATTPEMSFTAINRGPR